MSTVQAELPDVLRGCYESSFAYKTITERLPVILTKVIDLICREKAEIISSIADEEAQRAAADQLKTVCGQLSELKSCMQRNHELQQLSGAGADVISWNTALQQAAAAPSAPSDSCHDGKVRWFSAPWLLVECYMYRKIKEIMDSSPVLSSYDYFLDQKMAALHGSMKAAEQLASYVIKSVAESADIRDSSWRHSIISSCLGMSLWANRNDLSLSAGSHVAQLESPLDQLESLSEHVLVNDTALIIDLLDNLSFREHSQIDIVMDNAGFELFADLCLAHALVQLGVTKSIVFHVKCMPWYVSDVVRTDVDHLLTEMCSSGTGVLSGLCEVWRQMIKDGVWRFEAHQFWTSPHPFTHMKLYAPDLYSQLQLSNMVIFKGDLNYRKLLADRNWHHSLDFCCALQSFRPTNVVALRTLKADLVAGLPAERESTAAAADAQWMVNGGWAVIQLCPLSGDKCRL